MIFVRFTVPSSAVRKLPPWLFMLSNTFFGIVVLGISVVFIIILHRLPIQFLER
jgi:hypothetical protein